MDRAESSGLLKSESNHSKAEARCEDIFPNFVNQLLSHFHLCNVNVLTNYKILASYLEVTRIKV